MQTPASLPPWAARLGLTEATLAALTAAIPALHRWYAAAARDLPWRRTRDPYAIWVSEIMLQQTRVATVIGYYLRWLEALPTVASLARADEEQVLRLWEGLGYYRRVQNLHRAAREVVDRFGGEIPEDPQAFRSLPGVGPYSAAAVLSIAYGAELAAVDGNVRRVFARLLALPTDPASPAAAAALQHLADHLLPPGTGREHNQALMELGAGVCAPRRPRCGGCCLAGACAARGLGSPEAFPVRRRRPPLPHYRVAVGVVLSGGRLLVARRPYGGLLGGLWEFPGGKLEEGETPEEALRRELAEELGLTVAVRSALDPVDHTYTHLKVTLHPFVCELVELDPRAGEGREHAWAAPGELASYPMPRANRKIIAQAGFPKGSKARDP